MDSKHDLTVRTADKYARMNTKGNGAHDRPQATETASGGRTSPVAAKRNFGTMDPERQREIASEGGKAAHAKGRANKFTSEQGRSAALKGWEIRAARQSAGTSQGQQQGG